MTAPALHLVTPLIQSSALSDIAGTEIWLKMESAQPPGSFKIRGIGALCADQAARGCRTIISSSGGNAGIAAAYAARRLGLAAKVFVPETTSPRAKALIGAEGAEVITTGASWAEAHQSAIAALDPQSALVHPFDDPVMWEGHATMIDEAAAQGPRPDAVVLSVGGGGLLLGVAQGLARQGMQNLPILTVETTGAASLATSIANGSRVTLDKISSIATSLGAKQVAAKAFDLTMSRDIQPHVVTDLAAVSACLAFLEDHRTLVEPACGAALSLAHDPKRPLQRFRRVLIIVCGGATATSQQLHNWSADLRQSFA